MNPMERRVTQKDIAKKLGIHRSTVSLVFKNHPAVAKETKTLVTKVANEMGYLPDPMLASLAAYRHRNRKPTFHGTLAWLVNGRRDFDWMANRHYGEYFAGARTRAKQQGYELDVFALNTGIGRERLAGIMRARNIPGLLVCPQPPGERYMDFNWERFACVTFGHSLLFPRLHMVTAAHFHAVRQCLRVARERGYTRVGLAIARVDDARIDNAYSAAYLGEQFLEGGQIAIPPFFGGHDTFKQHGPLHTWIAAQKPDAIVTNNFAILPILKSFGLQVPDDLAVLCASMPAPDPHLTGIVEDSSHIGAVAVDFLVGMVQHGTRGVPEQPQRIHVEGVWNEGKSTRS